MRWCWLIGHRWTHVGGKNGRGDYIVVCSRCRTQTNAVQMEMS